MQDKFLKTLIYTILGIILIIFLMVQPFNIYCKTTKNCYPITFSSFKILQKGQEKFTVNFRGEVPSNLSKIVKFHPLKKEITKFSNEYIENSYVVKNLTNEEITVKAHYQSIPAEANQYLDRIECLCFQTETLKPQEEIKMPIRFKIKSEIEKQDKIKNIEISYTLQVI